MGWVGLDFIEDKSKLKLNKEEYMKFEMKFIKIKYKSIIAWKFNLLSSVSKRKAKKALKFKKISTMCF